MNHALSKLIRAASKVAMTDAEREEQRISFSYGSAKIENDLITEDMVRDASRRMKEEADDDNGRPR